MHAEGYKRVFACLLLALLVCVALSPAAATAGEVDQATGRAYTEVTAVIEAPSKKPGAPSAPTPNTGDADATASVAAIACASLGFWVLSKGVLLSKGV